MEHIEEAIIEIPQKTKTKFEIDKERGKIKLDRVLFSAMNYPAEYGNIKREEKNGRRTFYVHHVHLFGEPSGPVHRRDRHGGEQHPSDPHAAAGRPEGHRLRQVVPGEGRGGGLRAGEPGSQAQTGTGLSGKDPQG